MPVDWDVSFHDTFADEFADYSDNVRIEIAALIELLQMFGPQLGRPHADTLNASKHANMKELRFKADNGVWRVAFAFDPERTAILLVGGDKVKESEKRFYRKLIDKADERFDEHLRELKEKE